MLAPLQLVYLQVEDRIDAGTLIQPLSPCATLKGDCIQYRAFGIAVDDQFEMFAAADGPRLAHPHVTTEQQRRRVALAGRLQARELLLQTPVELIQGDFQIDPERWAQIVDLSQMNLRFLEACTPGYYNNEGKPSERSVKNGSYGAGSLAFIKVLEDWRDEGSLAGLELS